MSNNKQDLIKHLFLSVLYSGYSPKAPGTAGTIMSVILGIPILYFSQETLFLLSILVGLLAIKHIDIYEDLTHTHDDKSIVIDELVGVWLAMAFVGWGILNILCAFVFFRIFDIWKPSFIGRIDREVKGGLGVVGDDALAGVLAGIVSLFILWGFGFLDLKNLAGF